MKPLFQQVANFISLTRIFGVVFIFWITPYQTNYWLIITILIYTVICLTDLLDGWVARRFHQVSDIGKILDPLADKIVVLVLLPLLEMQVISSFPVFIILAREFAIMGLRVAAARKGKIVPATLSGKIKTALTLPICGILFARVPVAEVANLPHVLVPLNWLRCWVFSWPHWFFNVLIWLMVAVTVWSFLDYFGSFIWEQYFGVSGRAGRKTKRSLRKWIPNIITSINLLCGLVSILFTLTGRYHITAILILSSLLLDALDGMLARRLNVETSLGAKLDSKADFISFGISPAVVIFKKLLVFSRIKWLLLGAGILALGYYGAVHYRLRRFDKTGHGDFFEGLPSPVGAVFVVVAAISNYLTAPFYFVPIVIVASLLMVSRIPYAHTDYAMRCTVLRYMKYPALLFYALTILNLMDIRIATNLMVYEVLFAITCIYVFSPLFINKKN